MPEPPPAPRYCAFISYAREDEVLARWLQRRIETYRLPRRLRRRGIAARLGRVFRDRVEFSADADLEAALRGALAESDFLIVVCSPAAAASPWVRREVEMFRGLHGRDRILAALAAGEPADAFPAPLAAAGEAPPLAADFRAHGDGRRLGSLKLVAAIARLRLDELLRRDAQRRARWLAWVAAGALTLAAAMAALALIAVHARTAAEVQREKAEGLVDFMLTDLRKRLQGVGRLELLTDVNREAIGYYNGEDLARLPPASLERRAALLHAMGEDDEKRGQLTAAQRQWAEARRTTATLLAAAPNDPERVFAHSQSEYWVGFGAWRAGDLAGAKAGFLAYARLVDQARRQDPGNLDYALEQGNAFSNLGAFTLRPLGQAELAETEFQKALAAFEAVAAKRPDDIDLQVQIADGFGWLADAHRQQGRFAVARASVGRETALLRQLQIDNPADLEIRRRLISNALGRARIEREAGQSRVSLAIIDAFRQESFILARSDPTNKETRDAARMLALSGVASWLDLPAKLRPVGLVADTAFCAESYSIGDEVAAWCRILRARFYPMEANRLLDAVRADRLVTLGIYSRRRGIDFRRELRQ